MNAELDMVFKNINVLDGTGTAAYQGNIGIKGGTIHYIGKGECPGAETLIEGDGYFLAPGFIDVHAHYDNVLYYDPVNFCKLSQGVTTEISGNCGISMAPVSQENFLLWKTFLERSTGGSIPPKMQEYLSHDRYFRDLDQMKMALNVAYLIGQGAVRTAVMGFNNRKATDAEMRRMKDLVRNGMENGAVGLSTGLIFPPGSFTPTEELVELCRVVREYGGVYATHIRDESKHVLDSIREAIEIGRQSGVSVEISHLKVNGRTNWGIYGEALGLIETARREGIEVTADMYPYTAGATPFNFIIPPRYSREGTARMLEILSDRSNWPEIKEEMLNPKDGWDSYLLNCGFEGIILMVAAATPEAVGKTIQQYAEERGVDPMEAIFEVLIKNQGAGVAAWFMINEDDMQNIMASPNVMFGTDGVPVPEGQATHPRIIGTFPRIVGRYAREKGVVRLEEAIRKMTSMPARKFGLEGKGLIKEGFDADLVMFRADTIRDRADYSDCYAHNQGIKYVVVNGGIVIDDNRFTGRYPGRLLRTKRV